MEWDDVLLFKLGDNATDEAPCKCILDLWCLARRLTNEVCPHSAFMDPSVPKDTPSRVSIEVRSIIFGWFSNLIQVSEMMYDNEGALEVTWVEK
jgi:hypothetical protein